MATDKKKIRYFSSSLTYLLLSQMIGLLIRLISRILIARYSSPIIFGNFSVIWSEMTLISTIALLGLGQKLTIELPRENNASKTIQNSLKYAIIMSFACGIIALVLLLNLQQESTNLYSFYLSIVFLPTFLFQFIFIGLKDFKGFFINNISLNLVFVLFVIIIRNNLSIVSLSHGAFVSFFVSTIISVFYVIKKDKISFSKFFSFEKNIFRFDKNRFFLFSVDIVNAATLYILLKIPQILIGPSFSAYVNIAFSVLLFILIFPQIIATSLGPLISEKYKAKDYTDVFDSIRISLNLIYILQGLIIITFIYFGDVLIGALYGAEYVYPSIVILYGLILATIFDSFNYPFGFFIRNSGKERIFALGKYFSFIGLAIPLIILTTYDFSIISITLSYYILTTILFIFYYYHSIKENLSLRGVELKNILIWISLMIVSFVLFALTKNLFENYVSVIITYIINISVFCFVISVFKIIDIHMIKSSISYFKSLLGFNKRFEAE